MTSTTTETAGTVQATDSDGERLRLAVIVGSVREGRFGPTVSDWFAREARRYGTFDVDVIDLAEPEHTLPMVFPDFSEPRPADIDRVHEGLSRRLHAADAFVVVTPEYNHSFPASLKNTIDWFHSEWSAKPVGLISYGGMAGGQRAAEHLRQVFPELHAVTVRATLSFAMAWERFDEDGEPHDVKGTSEAARGMLGELEWWGDALRAARRRTPAASVV